MLDTSTKKRIDDCRDILVGKLPDPKAQIEQITIGLIYKFMDDMDKEAIELGGEAKFFSGDFEKYSWDSLFDTKVTATEMLGLYSEAIVSMDKNPKIPQLFRDIFKNAYLPYRDPETLKMFLKTIGEFEYTHSEMLGDAFEYLLSVMGSQGDAGQFRTPRHIIDFLVAVVDPKKTDTILDPACGTAGFLISAFKHIMGGDNGRDAINRVSTPNHVSTNPHTTLTPDERKRIIGNCTGYDISPDMVRLSLVNLYLHGFSDPHVSEYDTLSSEERWDENFDVILANPPFMSPKGGIRPHKKLTISSNRSEVLFVDYIAEHLNPKGRAGIIVPEGVIFQSGTAYKDLRKMLVDNYLYAVVSLPAGIFNPYSGVKTSILLMDKEISKKSSEILFVKIANDGFNLGAQRNAVKGGQLDDAIEIIRGFTSQFIAPVVETRLIASLPTTAAPSTNLDKSTRAATVETANLAVSTKLAVSTPPTPPSPDIAHAVPKSVIAQNGDYNLSGERYKNSDHFNKSSVEIVKLEDVAEIEYGYTDTAKDEGDARFIRITDINGNGQLKMDSPKFINLNKEAEKYVLRKDDILVARTGATFGKTLIYESEERAVFASFLIRIKLNKIKVLPKYYWAFAQSDVYWDQANNLMTGGGQPQFNGNALKQIQIPLPPLSIQEEIVAEIEACQKIIDGAKMVVSNYKPKIDIDPEWEIVELGDVCKIKGGNAFKSDDYVSEGVQLIRMGNVKQMFFDVKNSPSFLPEEYLKSNPNYILEKGDLLISMTGTIGKEDYGNVCQVDISGQFLLNQRVGKFELISKKLLREYIYYFANSDNFRKQLFANSSGGVRQSNISNKGIENIIIPLPPLKTQRQIVLQIEKEQQLVNANKQLIEIFEQKIKDRIAKVWGSSTTPAAVVETPNLGVSTIAASLQ